MSELPAGYLTQDIIRQALDSMITKRIPRLDELTPEILLIHGIDPRTFRPVQVLDIEEIPDA